MSRPQTAIELPWKRQRLRVPRQDATLFALPGLHQAAELAIRNRQVQQTETYDAQGRSLERLCGWTRETAYNAARQYTSEITGETIPKQSFDLLILAGHQPSFFHPGVWAKNFAIGQLASQIDGVALNLVVDNDAFSSARIRVPYGNREAPSVDWTAFDDDRPSQPWEDAPILNDELFRSFGDRVTSAMDCWNVTPLSAQLWTDAVEHMSQSPVLADCLTAARNRLERRWGLHNLELPISRLCRLDPFLWFASHLFANLPRFRDIHNQVLLEYRRFHRIRSRTHPVPDLNESDGWLEAPFWVWRTGARQRRRVFAQQIAGEVCLADGTQTFAKLPLRPDMEACCAVEALRELPAQGIHLRTRALTTTLFSRLCLGDLFVHGIGGAKYDEMTDHIISRFFKLTPPGFLTLSATLQLPLGESFNIEPSDRSRLHVMLRDLQYNSQRHLTSGTDGEVDTLIAKKAGLISEQHSAATTGFSRRSRRNRSRSNFERFRQFQDVNERLEKFTESQRERIEDELHTIGGQLQANSILRDREFAFCLYPAERIRKFMTGIGNMVAVTDQPGYFKQTAADE